MEEINLGICLQPQGETGLWFAVNEGMEKNMDTTRKGNIGTTIRIHSSIPSQRPGNDRDATRSPCSSCSSQPPRVQNLRCGWGLGASSGSGRLGLIIFEQISNFKWEAS